MLPALRRALPTESFVYVADSGHAPYGDRPVEHLRTRADVVFSFLLAQGAKAVVLACNTLSVALAGELRERFAPLPIVAMEPAIKPAVAMTRSGRVLVLATTATVRSAAVARLVERFAGTTQVLLQACPGLVEQVERGDWDAPATHAMLAQYVRPGVEKGADTIVLGCTHYAFLADAIRAVAGPGVALMEPSDAVARQLARVVAAPAPGQPCATVFHTSGDATALRAFLARLGEPGADVRPLPA